MNTYNLKRWTYFSLCLAFVFAGTALFYGIRAEKYERNMLYQNEASLSSLVYSTEEMARGLQEMQYGNDGMALAQNAARVYAASQSAKAALGALPLSDAYALQYEKLINQAGEYALWMLTDSNYSNTSSEQKLSSLSSVLTALNTVNQSVSNMKERLDVGETLPNPSLSGKPCLSSEFKNLEKEFPQYDSLNYDGGFSDHISTLSPLHTAEMNEISLDNAKDTAAGFLQMKPSDLKLLYESKGTVPVFAFGDKTRTVEITKAGGLVLTYSNRRAVSSSSIPENEARQKALQYATDLGYPELYCRYSMAKNNVLTCYLIPRHGDVAVYPDKVTVSVALDNGELMAFDSGDYVMSHTNRQLTLPGIIPDGAALALVPTDGMGEKLCFEYTEDGYLRYVCAESGQCYKIHVFEEGEQQGLADYPLPVGSFSPKA